MGVAVPATKLLEIIDMPDVKKDRDTRIAEMARRGG